MRGVSNEGYIERGVYVMSGGLLGRLEGEGEGEGASGVCWIG